MPKCLNNSKKYYTGKELSPKGLGICASAENIGTEKKGKDSNYWIIKENKKGIKYWSRIKKNNSLFTIKSFYNIDCIVQPKDILNYNQNYVINTIQHAAIPELKKIGKFCTLIPVPISDDNIYWSDYTSSYLNKFFKNFDYYTNFIHFIFYLDKDLDINLNKPIKVEYSFMELENKKKVIDILYEYLPNNVIWDGNNNKSMKIYYQKLENNTKPIKLYENDTYPVLYLDIFFEKGTNLLDINPDLSQIYEIFDKNSCFIDYSYGVDDISFIIYKISKYKKCKDMLQNIKSISGSKINKFSYKYYSDINDRKNKFENLLKLKSS